jgi:hypothetical protein
MLVDIARGEELEQVASALEGAIFQDMSMHVVDGNVHCEIEFLRAVPDQAEEYWSGKIHKTRVPWIRCVVGLRAIRACHIQELDEEEEDTDFPLAWSMRSAQCMITIRTPLRTEIIVVLNGIQGCCEDTGELCWSP